MRWVISRRWVIWQFSGHCRIICGYRVPKALNMIDMILVCFGVAIGGVERPWVEENGEWRWQARGDRLYSNILPSLSNYALICPYLSPSLSLHDIKWNYWGRGVGMNAYFAAIIWSKRWVPGRRRARRERAHVERHPAGRWGLWRLYATQQSTYMMDDERQ